MLHKMGYEGYCAKCNHPVTNEDIANEEDGICHDCNKPQKPAVSMYANSSEFKSAMDDFMEYHPIPGENFK